MDYELFDKDLITFTMKRGRSAFKQSFTMDYSKLFFDVYINGRAIITGEFNPYFIKINGNLI